MGAFQRMWIIVPLVIALIVAVVIILRQQSQLYDARWTLQKVVPLMIEDASTKPEDREYLDPESLRAWTRGEIPLDQVKILSEAETESPTYHS